MCETGSNGRGCSSPPDRCHVPLAPRGADSVVDAASISVLSGSPSLPPPIHTFLILNGINEFALLERCVMTRFLSFLRCRRHASLPVEVSEIPFNLPPSQSRRIYPCRTWKSASFG